MSLSTLEIRRSAASLHTRKSPFLSVNRSPLRYGFCAGAKAIRYIVVRRSIEMFPTLLLRKITEKWLMITCSRLYNGWLMSETFCALAGVLG